MRFLRARIVAATVLVVAALSPTATIAADAPTPTSPVTELRAESGLGDPFRFLDGRAVTTAADWLRRREELKQLFSRHVYGSLPPRPEAMRVEHSGAKPDPAREVLVEELVLHLVHRGNELALPVRLEIPLQSTGQVPVILRSSFALPLPPGAQVPPPEPSLYTKHGYATASFRFTDAAADQRGAARDGGIYALFGRDLDTGALLAWAWAMHRVIDALEREPRIDARRVVVDGHSRHGKAALLAGAFDERIALTVAQHSGSAGAAPFRFVPTDAEQLHNAAGYAPHWFHPQFAQFVGHVDRLPIDQHLLKALVAPRALLCTEGTQDTWTNPAGSQLTHFAAKEVYRFLGAEERISIRFRSVGHVPSAEDVVAFADHLFFGKPLPPEFGRPAFPSETTAYSWRAPAK